MRKLFISLLVLLINIFVQGQSVDTLASVKQVRDVLLQPIAGRVTNLSKILGQSSVPYSVQSGKNVKIIPFGDSWTRGIGSAGTPNSGDTTGTGGINVYWKQLQRILNNPIYTFPSVSLGYPGKTADWVYQNRLAYALNQADTNAVNIYLLMFGPNDIPQRGYQQAYQDLIRLSNAIRSYGYKTIVATQASANPQIFAYLNLVPLYDQQRLALGSLIRANWSSFADGLMDFKNQPSMYKSDGWKNTVLYASPDGEGNTGLHPADSGYTVIGTEFAQAVSRLTRIPLNYTPYQSYPDTATYSVQLSTDTLVNAATKVVWTKASQFVIAGTDSIYYTRTNGMGGYTGYIRSVASYSGTTDYSFQWTVSPNKDGIIVGLSEVELSTLSIDNYKAGKNMMYTTGTGVVIFESGTNIRSFSAPSPSTLKIRDSVGTVTYYLNGTLIYTSLVQSPNTMFAVATGSTTAANDPVYVLRSQFISKAPFKLGSIIYYNSTPEPPDPAVGTSVEWKTGGHSYAKSNVGGVITTITFY